MAAQHAARYTERDSRRHLPSLPSIKELNFQYRPPPPDTAVQNHQVVDSVPQERHSQQWARNPVSPALPVHIQQPHSQQQQHTPPLSASHEMPTKVMEYTQKPDSAGYLTPGIPLSAQVTPVPGSVTTGTRGDDPQNQPKRPRNTNSTSVNVPREVRPVHNYPAYHPYTPQPPPSSFHHQVPPPQHDQMNPQTPISSHPGYPAYAHPYPQPRTTHAPPPPPIPHQAPHNPYPSPAPPPPPPLPQNHWEHHQQQHPSSHQQHPPPQPPPQPEPMVRMPHPVQPLHHHPAPPPPAPPPAAPSQETYVHPQSTIQQHTIDQVPYSRTSSLVPPPVDTRNHYVIEPPQLSPRASTMSEIVKLCSLLYSFAMRYAQADTQPNQTELAEMAQKANEVVRLLEDLRRMYSPNAQDTVKSDSLHTGTPDDHRPPKRPWEELTKEGLNGAAETHEQFAGGTDKSQTTAEQDMELIRTKRATTTTGSSTTAGQTKSKYRKRSRATPPGKCHSCNIRETPEWRRGPDGARTLCNACGLHYAKLMRKRIQLNGPGAPTPQIDMDTLRASARASEQEKNKSSSKSIHSDEPPSPMETSTNVNNKPLPAPTPQHQHQNSFQVVSMVPPPDPSPTQHIPPSPVSGGPTPSSPWSSNTIMNGRGYKASDPIQHQSFLRTSQTSPR